MSGSESPSFEWFISLGNLLSIIISVSVVIGAIFTLVRYLKQNVTKGIVELKTDVSKEICDMREDIKKDIGYIGEKIHDQQAIAKETLEQNARRLDEVKNLIAMVERRMEDTKQDTNKRIDVRMSEITRLSEKLDQLKDEHYRLTVAIAKKLDVQEEMAAKREDRARHREEKVDRIIDTEDHE